ncbi:MAG: RNA polymerase sigma-70 factor [Chitinophagaceae bacterium]|nr:RNA polymerase sigma-70 factor [Chitinophagaceae bacterium]
MEQIRTERTDTLTVVTTASFEAIFKVFYKGLYRYACTLIKNEFAAEGIVQQVFLRLWEKKEDLSPGISAKAYLYKSVYHHCLNYIKHQQIRSVHAKYMTGLPPSFSENAEGKILGKELQEHIQAALSDLPEQCGVIFRMSRFEGLKYQEIAHKLGLSVKTIEAQMGKALKLLRLKLAAYLPAVIVWCLLTSCSNPMIQNGIF